MPSVRKEIDNLVDDCIYLHEENDDIGIEARIDQAELAILALLLTEEEIRRIIIDKELVPDVCVDSGQVEWSVGESRKLAHAIHTAMVKKLGGEK